MVEARVLASLAAGLGILAAGVPAAADGIGNETAPAWETCALCHGLDGNSAMAKFPKLAGQSAAYIEKQLQDFRSGERHNDGGQMAAIVTEISEDQIAQVAHYFARQPRAPGNGDATSRVTQRAAMLFARGDAASNIAACSDCHVALSGGPEAAAVRGPHLNGQHEDYLAKQLRDFRSGARRNDAAGTMQAVASQLSLSEIDELAAYLSALPPAPPSTAQ